MVRLIPGNNTSKFILHYFLHQMSINTFYNYKCEAINIPSDIPRAILNNHKDWLDTLKFPFVSYFVIPQDLRKVLLKPNDHEELH